MSGLAELSQRHARLQEISGIMSAMKALSLVETNKLARFLGHQQRMRANIENAAADFIAFHPEVGAPAASGSTTVVLLVGSERGFCGNFNDRIVQTMATLQTTDANASLLVIGQRLSGRLGSDGRVLAHLEGATVAEDVPAVLERLLDALPALRSAPTRVMMRLLCLSHNAHGEPELTRLLPLAPAPVERRHADAPQLLLTPGVFYRELLDQFLLAALYGQLYASLAAENHQRLAHMENALDRLDQSLQRLALRRNSLRQERITEEIEIMLSNTGAS